MEDEELLINRQTHISTKRWWAEALFAYASFLLALVWNSMGPVANALEAVYGWDDGTVAMFGGYGNIAYIICAVPASLLMDAKGMKYCLRLCAFVVLVGTSLRCLPVSDSAFKWMSYLCAVLNGIVLPVTFGGPAKVATTWFPENEESTATGIATFFNYLGIAMEFVLGPQIVSDPVYIYKNLTNQGNFSDSNMIGNGSEIKVLSNLDTMRSEIHYLMYVHCGLAGLLFLAVLFGYPSDPEIPAQIKVTEQTGSSKDNLKSAGRNLGLWLMVMAYAIPTGSLAGWSSVLAVNLQAIDISQIDAGWMGFWNTLGGCFAGLGLAWVADRVPQGMLKILIVCMILTVGSCAWFVALCNQYIPYSKASLYAACILIGVFINGPIPVFYTMSCDTSHPVPGGLTGGFLTLVNNVIGMLFLLVLSIPNAGTAWMNWCLLGSGVISIPLLIIFKLIKIQEDKAAVHLKKITSNGGLRNVVNNKDPDDDFK